MCFLSLIHIVQKHCQEAFSQAKDIAVKEKTLETQKKEEENFPQFPALQFNRQAAEVEHNNDRSSAKVSQK